VVSTGMKKTVSRVDRSSRWWCAKEWQYWQLAGLPGNSLVMVLRPKSRNIVVPFRAGPGAVSKLAYHFSATCNSLPGTGFARLVSEALARLNG
jgi:hypothetical protein